MLTINSTLRKKILCLLSALVLISAVFTPVSVLASNDNLPTLADISVTEAGGVRTMVMTYEAAPELSPDFSTLIEEPFEYEGSTFIFQYASINEVMQTESRWERAEVSFPVETEDLQPVYKQLTPNMPYNGEDDFTGWLDLDYTAVWTEPAGYEQKRFTMTDTVVVNGLSSNDSSSIPKTKEKSGVTMTLQNVDWSVQESTNIDGNSIPTKYNATAYYSGSYSKQVTTGYIARAWYGGEVSKTGVEKVIYTLNYAAETVVPIATEPEVSVDATNVAELETEIDTGNETEQPEIIATLETTPLPVLESTTEPETSPDADGIEADTELEPSPEPEPVSDEKESNNQVLLVILLVLGLLAGLIIGGYFLLFRHNVLIYTEDKGRADILIGRQFIKLNNPVVDLRRVKISGDKVVVMVLEKAASLLHGRSIETIVSDDYSINTTVKKKNGNFRYVVTIPDEPETDSDDGYVG